MSEKQEKNFKVKGNILYELLAVVLAVALFLTLTYPNKLWKQEDANTELCRENIQHILAAEITYMDSFLFYNDTLEVVVDHILSDTTKNRLTTFTDMDTVLTAQIISYFNNNVMDTVQVTVDSIFGEGPDSMAVVLRDFSIPVLLDSLRKHVKEADLGRVEGDPFILDSLRHWPVYSEKIDSMALFTLNNMFTCPTSGKPYLIEAFNDTTPQFVNIYCPLDSTDSEELKQDFKRYKLGGLRFENHGSIKNLEKSW